MATIAESPSRTKTDEFQTSLAQEWKYDREGPESERRFCPDKHFFDTIKLRKWMQEESLTGTGESKSNAKQLLEEVTDVIGVYFPPPIVDENEEKCFMLVFAILLVTRDSSLIHLFQKANINDKWIEEHSDFPSLRKTLEEHNHKFGDSRPVRDIEDVISRFERERWNFSPVRFSLEMRQKVTSRMILPFRTFRQMNEGGTAAVYHVTVPAGCVADDMKISLKVKKSDNEREFYPIAIKSYSHHYKDTYEQEVEAFTALQKTHGIIRQFGSYVVPSNRDHMYQIVLELGSMNLDDYFYDQSPPELPSEILYFWNSMLSIAKTIQELHLFTHEGPLREIEYIGQHCDVKPGNILRVRNEWKLADFGFSAFKLFEQDSTTSARFAGGTETFGAPEIAQRRAKARSSEPLPEIDQRVDVWSLGCVLSVAGTWIAAGAKGIENYSILRWKACGDTRTDAFHRDGQVLPEIYRWHQYLRSVLRKSDAVSDKVLDMIEEDMLITSNRKESTKIHERFSDIINTAQEETKDNIHKSVRNAILFAEQERISQRGGEDASPAHPWITELLSRGPSRSGSRLSSQLYEYEGKKEGFTLPITSAREAELEKVLSRSSRQNQDQSNANTRSGRQLSLSSLVGSVPGPSPTGRDREGSLAKAQQWLSLSHTDQGEPSDNQTTRSFSTSTSGNPGIQSSEATAPTSFQDIPDHSRSGTVSGNAATSTNQSPYLLEMFEAIRGGSLTTCEKVLREHPKVTNYQYAEDCSTPIMEAVRRGQQMIVRALMEHSTLTITDNWKRTVVHHAVLAIKITRHEATAGLAVLKEILTSTQFPSEVIDMVDGSGFSALFHCAWDRNNNRALYDAAVLLLKHGAQINAPVPGQTGFSDVLIEAAKSGDENMIRLLRCKKGQFRKELMKDNDYKALPKQIKRTLTAPLPELSSQVDT